MEHFYFLYVLNLLFDLELVNWSHDLMSNSLKIKSVSNKKAPEAVLRFWTLLSSMDRYQSAYVDDG